MTSSRVSLERAAATVLRDVQYVVLGDEVKAYVFGAICRKPSALTAFSRARNMRKAELCGNSMRRPYRHLKRYG